MFNARILITTYPEAFFMPGGGEVEIIEISSTLARLGIFSDIYGPTSLPLKNYDVVFHYSIIPSGIGNLQTAKSFGKKTVLMPALWWSQKPSEDEINNAIQFFKLSDHIVFKSNTELDNIKEFVKIDEHKIVICRWGIEPAYGFPTTNPNLFKDKFNLKKFILWVGMIEPRKNQLSAIQALKKLDIPIVFIGDYRERNYYEECIKSSPSSFKFIPFLSPKTEILRAAYNECSTYLELSSEPAGFSAFEAGLSGANLVLSRGEWATENFGNNVIQVNPYSHSEILDGVIRSLSTPKTNLLSEKIRAVNVLPQSLQPLAEILAN
jgi:glycosyltransferase involved in cell wall biosynthesis